jgi:hypothetical protein
MGELNKHYTVMKTSLFGHWKVSLEIGAYVFTAITTDSQIIDDTPEGYIEKQQYYSEKFERLFRSDIDFVESCDDIFALCDFAEANAGKIAKATKKAPNNHYTAIFFKPVTDYIIGYIEKGHDPGTEKISFGYDPLTKNEVLQMIEDYREEKEYELSTMGR